MLPCLIGIIMATNRFYTRRAIFLENLRSVIAMGHSKGGNRIVFSSSRTFIKDFPAVALKIVSIACDTH